MVPGCDPHCRVTKGLRYIYFSCYSQLFWQRLYICTSHRRLKSIQLKFYNALMSTHCKNRVLSTPVHASDAHLAKTRASLSFGAGWICQSPSLTDGLSLDFRLPPVREGKRPDWASVRGFVSCLTHPLSPRLYPHTSPCLHQHHPAIHHAETRESFQSSTSSPVRVSCARRSPV